MIGDKVGFESGTTWFRAEGVTATPHDPNADSSCLPLIKCSFAIGGFVPRLFPRSTAAHYQSSRRHYRTEVCQSSPVTSSCLTPRGDGNEIPSPGRAHALCPRITWTKTPPCLTPPGIPNALGRIHQSLCGDSLVISAWKQSRLSD
ncbi:hypothetical protein Bbelb_168090 [Branchiostoma belcheri]|nr:hypothetical protein Bbelb_168090 [Branchiostoma belcheri]